MTNRTKLLMSAAAGIAAFGAVPAFAAGTTANSSIVNTATVNYTVGGVAQTAINASNTLTVDRVITMLVTEPGNAATAVVPGQANAVTTFLVTNTSNATLDFGLALAQPASGTTVHGQTDTFDVTAPTFWINTGPSAGSATFDPGNSVQVTFLDELAADATRYVFVRGSVPAGETNGEAAGVNLTIQAREAGAAGTQGAIVAQTVGANTAGMDTVFADVAGATDAARDGQHSARDSYLVGAPVLTVTKTSRVIEDPINTIASGNAANAKMIPGATIEYCIAVANGAGGATATAPVVSDNLPANTTFVAGSIRLDSPVAGGVCTGGSAGGTFTAAPAPGNVTGTLSDVTAGSTLGLRFQVTIN